MRKGCRYSGNQKINANLEDWFFFQFSRKVFLTELKRAATFRTQLHRPPRTVTTKVSQAYGPPTRQPSQVTSLTQQVIETKLQKRNTIIRKKKAGEKKKDTVKMRWGPKMYVFSLSFEFYERWVKFCWYIVKNNNAQISVNLKFF